MSSSEVNQRSPSILPEGSKQPEARACKGVNECVKKRESEANKEGSAGCSLTCTDAFTQQAPPGLWINSFHLKGVVLFHKRNLAGKFSPYTSMPGSLCLLKILYLTINKDGQKDIWCNIKEKP